MPAPTAAEPVEPLHEDRWCVVLDKPEGLLSVPGRGPDKQDCLSARALRQWPDARIVHRLDMATSGLLLMARGESMQRAFSRAFESRQVGKHYVAVVAGRVPAAAATDADGWAEIDLPLAADWPRRPRQQVDHENGRPSRTRWRILQALQDRTRLELQPLTGRTHQLRVHLQAIGHPILGDALYGASTPPATRLLLHAQALELRHPVTGERHRWQSPAPF
nr:RluA family pseudouridine synthase [Ramlibacter aurantiacus]